MQRWLWRCLLQACVLAVLAPHLRLDNVQPCEERPSWRRARVASGPFVSLLNMSQEGISFVVKCCRGSWQSFKGSCSLGFSFQSASKSSSCN